METGERLRAVGLRVTPARMAVLDWLATHPHATADRVAAAVRERLSSASIQTVYDVLHACTRTGLLRRIEPAGHPARFEIQTGDHHHHLICRECDRIENVDHVVGFAPCTAPADDHGFVIDDAEVFFWGLCSICRRREAG